DYTQSDGRAKNLQVVIVDLVGQSGFPRSIKSVELIEIDGVAIGHDHAVKHHGQAALSEARDLLYFSKNESSFRNKYMLPVLAIDGVCDHRLHRPGEVAVQSIHQYGVDGCTFKQRIRLAESGVDVDFNRVLRGVVLRQSILRRDTVRSGT